MMMIVLPYIPSLFSFTKSPAKHRAEHDLERWKVVKQRRFVQSTEVLSSTEGLLVEEPSDEAMRW